MSEMKVGERAIVKQINNCEKVKSRLKNMGLITGVAITYVRKAPFGDPIEIKLRDFYLALRVCDAEKIVVEKI